jgi:hypothetical protein
VSRLIPILAVAFSLFVGTSASAQSLVEVAKKEKERRKQNEEKQVKVIDVQTLTQGWADEPSKEEPSKDEAESEEGHVTEPSLEENPENSSTPDESSSSTESSEESLAQMDERRRQCRKDLERAEGEKKRQQALFDQGVTQIATVESNPPKGPEGGTTFIIRGEPRISEGSVDIEGDRVDCREALRNSAKYPNEAKKCKAIKDKIEAAEKEIQQAVDCLRKR